MNDFLVELAYEGFTSRLKRLSDTLLYSTKELYQAEGIDIEPNWNLIFRLLQQQKEMNITEMAETLQFSHPAVIKIINKMKKQGYVQSHEDSNDKRKQVLTLTSKADKHAEHFENYWIAGIEVVEDLLSASPNFLEELTNIEKKVNEMSYKQRAQLKLKENEYFS